MGDVEGFDSRSTQWDKDERLAVLEKRVGRLDGKFPAREDDLEEFVDFLADKVKALERGQIFLVLLVSVLLTAVWELRRDG